MIMTQGNNILIYKLFPSEYIWYLWAQHYYYFKKSGEVEWKSFPYVTQKTLRQLPLRKIDFNNPVERQLHDSIAEKVSAILANSVKGVVPKQLDYEVEDLVMKLFKITPEMKQHIWSELKKVQKLRIIRDTIGW